FETRDGSGEIAALHIKFPDFNIVYGAHGIELRLLLRLTLSRLRAGRLRLGTLRSGRLRWRILRSPCYCGSSAGRANCKHRHFANRIHALPPDRTLKIRGFAKIRVYPRDYGCAILRAL